MNKKLFADIVRYYRETYKGVFPKSLSVEKLAAHLLSPAAAGRQRRLMRRFSLPSSKNERILDFGSGIGDYVLDMRLRGYFADGVEIDPVLVDIANRRVSETDSITGGG